MPDDDKTLSPPAEGMETPKPDAGNEPTSEGAESAPASGPPVVDVNELQSELNTVKKNYSDSSRNAQLLYNQNQMLQQQLALQRQQSPPPQPELNRFPPQMGSEDLLSPEEQEEYNNAIIDGKHDRARVIMAKRDQRLLDVSEKRVFSKLQQGNQYQNRIGESVQALSQHKELNDLNNPVTQRTMQLYGEMLQQKQFGGYSYIADDYIPAGASQVNPHLLNIAVMKAKAERLEKRDVGQQIVNASGQNFTEPAGGTAKVTARKEEDLLDEEEKRQARNYGMTFKAYFAAMDPEWQEERKRTGKPVRHKLTRG